jgi:uroporphyrinogen decarboxylase
MKPLLSLLKTKKATPYRPIWVMRQAGRYLPEYREVRKNFPSFIDFCLTPEAAAEVTIQPIRRFGFDAAIVFSDILIVPHALGVKVDFIEDFGPKMSPIRVANDFDKLANINWDFFHSIGKTLSLTQAQLKKDFPHTTLIGFAGAPWTVAAYMTEGASSKTFGETFKMVYGFPHLFDRLIAIIVEATIAYLKIQIEAGAEVLQLFDSWAGLVPDNLYEKYIVKPTQTIINALKKDYPDVPIIGFPRASGYNYKDYAIKTGVDAIALDQNISLAFAQQNFSGLVLQGNFDNMLLAYGNNRQIAEEAGKILMATENVPHIFNLGHGILPQTPIENVEALIEVVRKYESRS